ncbi:DUF2628 domain-containing protein [Clostridium botulinum]|uniref:DUF2628 domain-containing protein n=1 Tax=Clostridium botulinum TaxID=1491 RepID=UPI0019682A8C|nr:DUF2628 domain-containing protein [Clostridium botulinum]MBN1059872.1 DUF2628 domain-containing protein [Clostridium botulinum]MBN1063018.1 DUF2628 domain-containing protein [Clostridium botulinum]NFS10833.1 DUF2628 domain-containing protein [Clostridium botulinum]
MKCPYCTKELSKNNICNNLSCSNYQKKVHENISFCKNNNIENDSTESIDDNEKFNIDYLNSDISDEEFKSFVGEKKSSYYIEYFNRYKINNRFISWNWASFFFGAYWLLYRKLFLIFFLFLLITTGTVSLLGPFSAFTGVIISLVLGMFGNNIYIRFVEHKIFSIRGFSKNISKNISPNLTHNDYIKLLTSKGGTNSALAFLIILLINFLTIALLY